MIIGEVITVPAEEQSTVTAQGTILEKEDLSMGKYSQKPKLGGNVKEEKESENDKEVWISCLSKANGITQLKFKHILVLSVYNFERHLTSFVTGGQQQW